MISAEFPITEDIIVRYEKAFEKFKRDRIREFLGRAVALARYLRMKTPELDEFAVAGGAYSFIGDKRIRPQRIKGTYKNAQGHRLPTGGGVDVMWVLDEVVSGSCFVPDGWDAADVSRARELYALAAYVNRAFGGGLAFKLDQDGLLIEDEERDG